MNRFFSSGILGAMKNAFTMRWSNAAAHADNALLDIVAVAGAVMLGAWVRIPLPFSPVPITMQTLPVLLAGVAVGQRRATAGILLYVALGLIPYFALGMDKAPFFAAPVGPTLGYLAAFAAVPWLITRCRNLAAGIAAATGIIYVFGAAWLAIWTGQGLPHAVLVGIVPFLPGDILKAAAAYRLAVWARR